MSDNKNAQSGYCFSHAEDRPCFICATTDIAELIYRHSGRLPDYDILSVSHRQDEFRPMAKYIANGLKDRGYFAPLTAKAPTTAAQEALFTLGEKIMEEVQKTSDKREGFAYLHVYAEIRTTIDKMNKGETDAE